MRKVISALHNTLHLQQRTPVLHQLLLSLIRKYFPDDAIPVIEDIAEDVEELLSQDYADEMNGKPYNLLPFKS